MNRWLNWTLLLAALIAALLWLSTPAPVNFEPIPRAPGLPHDDDHPGLIPGTEKRIVWFDEQNRERTEWSVVYVHGFSATRQETAPLAQQVAERLGANLFETRLTGHGLQNHALVGATAEDWLEDSVEALATGAALGERIVVVATSTGATLITALLDHPLMTSVDALVFLSANYDLRSKDARRATGPGGKLLTRLLAGETRSWTPQNEAQGRFWSTRYPSSALIEMVRAMDYADSKLHLPSSQRWLLLYAEADQVIDPAAIRRVYETVDAEQKELLEIENPGDRSGHILAGDIMSPQTTDRVVNEIVEFILRPVP